MDRERSTRGVIRTPQFGMLTSSRHFAVEEVGMFGPASVRIRGPLRAHVEGFWLELLWLGYTPASAANQLRLAGQLSR